MIIIIIVSHVTIIRYIGRKDIHLSAGLTTYFHCPFLIISFFIPPPFPFPWAPHPSSFLLSLPFLLSTSFPHSLLAFHSPFSIPPPPSLPLLSSLPINLYSFHSNMSAILSNISCQEARDSSSLLSCPHTREASCTEGEHIGLHCCKYN